ncbi:MAG TPA: twin transmembrane helix small protein [Burkholderiaceae bacterium]|nr:twin transmembrane helix small protein [Burkholderiaceae bacterium]
MKAVLVVALLAVLVALGSAGLFMLRKPGARDPEDPADRRMARALAMRVAISVALFLFVLLAWHFGWIAPKGLPTGR